METRYIFFDAGTEFLNIILDECRLHIIKTKVWLSNRWIETDSKLTSQT